MENSLLVIFDEIWPKTLYYSTVTFDQFLSNYIVHVVKQNIVHKKHFLQKHIVLKNEPIFEKEQRL